MSTYSLIISVPRAALTSCVFLEGHKYVNTGKVPALELAFAFANYPDYKPANILLYGIYSERVIAKVGDLGLGE